jgi:hypothetical protein
VGSGFCTNRARGIAVDEANKVAHVAYRCGGGSGLNPVTDRLYLSLPGWASSPAEAHWVAVVADDLDTPTWPSGSCLVVSQAKLRSITLSWTPAVDGSGVRRYQIYRDGLLAVTVGAQTSAYIGDLTADTSYAFKVEACDAFDHCSIDGQSARTRSSGTSVAANAVL